MNLRDKILSKRGVLKSEIIKVPEWDDAEILVQELDGRRRSLLFEKTITPKGKMEIAKLYPQLLILSCFDPETKEPLFKDGDLDAISELGGAGLERVAQIAMRLSGLQDIDRENAAKNSE